MKRGPLALRLGGALIGLVAFLVFSRLLMPGHVDLTLQLPSDAPPVSALSVRVVNLEDGAEAYKGRRTRPQPGRSMPFRLRLAQGEYRVTAWTATNTYEGTLHFEGDDFVELRLSPG